MKRIIKKDNLTHKPRYGFTLTEILLVMLLISILVLGINAVYSQAHIFWSRITVSQPVYANSRVVFDAIRQELSSLYLPKPSENEEESPPVELFSMKTTSVSFLTLNPAWNANSVISKPAKITYRFQKPSEGVGSLIRTEQACSGEKIIGLKEREQIILDGIDSLTFEAIKGDKGKGSSENKEKPPQAIKLRLTWPINKTGSQNSFEVTLPVLCSDVLSLGKE